MALCQTLVCKAEKSIIAAATFLSCRRLFFAILKFWHLIEVFESSFKLFKVFKLLTV